MILVSACLAGEKCRYNGEALRCEAVAELVASGRAIAVCPEVLGGLPVPRPPAEIGSIRPKTRSRMSPQRTPSSRASTPKREAVATVSATLAA